MFQKKEPISLFILLINIVQNTTATTQEEGTGPILPTMTLYLTQEGVTMAAFDRISSGISEMDTALDRKVLKEIH